MPECNSKILTLAEVRLRVGNPSRVSIWRWTRAGLFPLPLQLSPNRVGWKEADIEAWIASRPRVPRRIAETVGGSLSRAPMAAISE